MRICLVVATLQQSKAMAEMLPLPPYNTHNKRQVIVRTWVTPPQR